jgi:hypothetical protein
MFCSTTSACFMVTTSQDAIPPRSLETARTWLRQELEIRHLPSLPEDIVDGLFLQGRSAWTFRYEVLQVTALEEAWRLEVQITALLKKEFKPYLDQQRYFYSAELVVAKADDSPIQLLIEPAESLP